MMRIRKSELDATNDANDETFPRPNVLPISNEDATDDKQTAKKTGNHAQVQVCSFQSSAALASRLNEPIPVNKLYDYRVPSLF